MASNVDWQTAPPKQSSRKHTRRHRQNVRHTLSTQQNILEEEALTQTQSRMS